MQRTVIIWMRDRSPDQREIGMAAGDTGRWTRRKHAEKVNTADRCAPNHCATITATNLCESSKIHLLERKTQRQRVSRPPPPPNRYCHINPFKCNPSPSTQRRMNSRPKVASHDRIASHRAWVLACWVGHLCAGKPYLTSNCRFRPPHKALREFA